jgi:hypothetical protein
VRLLTVTVNMAAALSGLVLLGLNGDRRAPGGMLGRAISALRVPAEVAVLVPAGSALVVVAKGGVDLVAGQQAAAGVEGLCSRPAAAADVVLPGLPMWYLVGRRQQRLVRRCANHFVGTATLARPHQMRQHQCNGLLKAE